MRREIPLIITFVCGITMIIQFFIPHDPFGGMKAYFQHSYMIIAAFAMLLGICNLTKIHVKKIRDKRSQWWYSIVLLAGLLGMAIPGLIFPSLPKIVLFVAPAFRLVGLEGIWSALLSWARSLASLGGIAEGTVFDFLFRNAHVPMQSTMFSLLAFFVASASYRAFRARTLDAALLLVAGFVVMLGRAPIGDSLTWFMPECFRLSSWANWIMAVPNTAGQRAIMMGAGLGIAATSLRVILGIERSYLGGE